MSTRAVLLAIALIAFPSSSALAQERAPQRPGAPPAEQESQRPSRHEVAGPNEEKVSQTSHAMRLDGIEIKYTATAGTVPIRLDDGKVAARMFFVAYTKDGEDVKTRPVSFLFNGGPGSASVWLHMGSFAPKIAKMADEGFQPAPPYDLVDNPNSLLDVSDLVFVDAIDTGYSRVMPGVENNQFHGQDGDIRAFGEFIAEYLRIYNRYPSPKFLIGESYGTIRSAGLAQELQSRHGIELNGIALLSALLTYQTLSPAPNNDIAWAVQIQTFAATAWYHKKLPADLQQKPIRQVVDEARTFAFGEYMLALTKGHTLTGGRAQRDGRASSPATRGSRRRTSSRPTCASIPGASARNCCAISAWSSGASTAASPRSTRTPRASARSSTRRIPRSPGRTSRLPATTSRTR